MRPDRHRLSHLLQSALPWGATFAVFYFLFVFFSLALTTGDGRAPPVTGFAVWTMDLALAYLAIDDKSGGLLPATIFWTIGFTALVVLVNALRGAHRN